MYSALQLMFSFPEERFLHPSFLHPVKYRGDFKDK